MYRHAKGVANWQRGRRGRARGLPMPWLLPLLPYISLWAFGGFWALPPRWIGPNSGIWLGFFICFACFCYGPNVTLQFFYSFGLIMRCFFVCPAKQVHPPKLWKWLAFKALSILFLVNFIRMLVG
jgi:hypothetical protein